MLKRSLLIGWILSSLTCAPLYAQRGGQVILTQTASSGGGGVALAHTPQAVCTSSAATTVPLTITSTTSGNALSVSGYAEGATHGNSTALVEVTNTVTFTGSYNPGVGKTVSINNAIPTGFNGVYVVATSSGTNFTYTDPTGSLGTATQQATAALVPTIAAAGVTFVGTEADGAYASGARTLMSWYAANIPASVTTLTMTLPVSATGCLASAEVSGVNASTPLDVACGLAVNCETSSNSPFTGGSVTPTASKNEFMSGAVFDGSGPDHTADFTGTGGWSNPPVTAYENGGNFGSFAFYYQIVSSTSGSYAITGTNSGTGSGQSITNPTTLKP